MYIKGEFVPGHTTKMYGRVDRSLYSFLSLEMLGLFTLEDRALSTHQKGLMMDVRASLGALDKRDLSTLLGFKQ